MNDSNDLQAETVFSLNNLLNVWCLRHSIIMSGYPKSQFYNFSVWKDDIDDPFINDKSDNGDFFGFFSILMNLGLVVTTFYAFNGDEVHCPNYTEDSDDIVSQLDFIASLYSKSQLEILEEVVATATDSSVNIIDEISDYTHRVVLPAKYKKVHLQSFYQLKYRTRLGESKVRYAQDKAVTRELIKLLDKVKKG